MESSWLERSPKEQTWSAASWSWVVRTVRSSEAPLTATVVSVALLFYVATRVPGDTLPRGFDVALVAIFLVLPPLLGQLLEKGSAAALPALLIYLCSGALAVAAESHATLGEAPGGFAAAALALLGVLALVILMAYESKSTTQGFVLHQRANDRIPIDRLVYLKVHSPVQEQTQTETQVEGHKQVEALSPAAAPSGPKGTLPESPPRVFATHVILRNISPTGVGLYGLPEDIQELQSYFLAGESRLVEIVYEQESARLWMDLRWWKSQVNTGQCGLRFDNPSEARKMVQTLAAQSAPSMKTKATTGEKAKGPAQRLALALVNWSTKPDALRSSFALVIWWFSMCSIVSLML